MSANENEFDLIVDPSEKAGSDRMQAAPQDEFEMKVDPSEGPAEPPE
jgi:hypothetical protein